MAAAVISLSLALGACSTAFSLIDALILRPLPVAHPDQLFFLTYPDSLAKSQPGVRREHDTFSYPQYQSFRQAAGSNLDLFAVSLSWSFTPAGFTALSGEEEPVRVEGISGIGFGLLGVTPALGRLFTSADDSPTQSPVAVLSYAFWSRRFSADPSVLDGSVTLAGRRFRIVGVTRRGFTGLRPGYLTDVWIPLTAAVDARTLASANSTWVGIWGRAKSGRHGEQALKVAWTNFRRDHAGEALSHAARPDQIADYLNTPLLIHSGASGADSLFRAQFARPLWILGVFSGLLLLIAISNVANLLTARAVAREREMALRIAIGASRWRLTRQSLVESGLLAFLSCSLGVAFGAVAAPFLAAQLGASNFPAWLDLRPEWRLLGFIGVVSALVTLFFGAIPVLRASAVNPDQVLKTSSKQSSAAGAIRPFLPIQVAFSFVVLFLSGLLLFSFERLTHVDLGFAPDHVILFTLNAKGVNPAMKSQLIDRIQSVSGVDSAALSQQAPIGGAFAFVMTPFIRFQGRDFERARPVQSPVSPGFFRTMRIRLLAGREFEPRDPESVVIVNEAFVQQYLPGEPVLGRHFEQMGDGKPTQLEIVGVVANSLFNNLREPIRPMMYTPLGNLSGAALEVRTHPDPRALASTLRHEIESIDPALRVRDSILQSARIANTLLSERLLAWLAAFFAIAALVLAGVGLHGVISYFVVRRTKEIGIRMALGAERRAVIRLIVRDVATLIGLGIVAGAATGLALARYAESLLFEVKPTDFRSLATPLICILAACVLAALRPAIRATRVDPVITLRNE